MPFYFHKSVKAGPFRFNLSGSGIGMSVGVKGLRIGAGPRGHYIHAGAGGFYYRSTFGPERRSAPKRIPRFEQSPATTQGVGPHVAVETGQVVEMIDTNAAAVLESVQHSISGYRSWPWVAIVGILVALVMMNGDGPLYTAAAVLTLMVTLATGAFLFFWDRERLTTVLMYDFEDDTLGVYRVFIEEFDDLGKSLKVMNIDTEGRIYDWKRNAGAGFEVKTSNAVFGVGAPRWIKTNVSVPFIQGGLNDIYFFPDILLVVQRGRVGGIDYRNLSINFYDQLFNEHGHVPGDGEVFGHTWRFVRRDGGPDRRFNNNRRIPVMRYQAMIVNGPGDFQKVLYFSNNKSRARFLNCIRGLALLHEARLQSTNTGRFRRIPR